MSTGDFGDTAANSAAGARFSVQLGILREVLPSWHLWRKSRRWHVTW